jgi:hypothetical protein
MIRHRLSYGIAREGRGLGQGEVVDATERVEVGSLIERFHLDLFGSDVVDRTEKGSALIERLERRLLAEFGETKIEELDLELAGSCQVIMMLLGLISRWRRFISEALIRGSSV